MCQGCDEDAQQVAAIVGVDVATVNAVRNAYRIIAEQREAEYEPIDMSGEDTVDLTDVLATLREAAPEATLVLVGGAAPAPEVRIGLARGTEGRQYVTIESRVFTEEQKVEVIRAALLSLTSDGNGGVTELGTIVGAPERDVDIQGWGS